MKITDYAGKKITLTHFKKFCRESGEALHILCKSSFDGMTDCVESTGEKEFHPARREDRHNSHTCGVAGVWLVGGSRDSFTFFQKDGFYGIHVYNCCGSFDVAVKLNAAPAPVEAAAPAAVYGGVTVTENEEKDGVELRFPGKPAEAIRDRLKQAGWRWSKFSACWYKRRSPEALTFARSLTA